MEQLPQLRNSMLEIEKLAKMSRDLAKVNEELEESRLFAVSDQARTATRLLLVSSQLEHTEQKLYTLTKELDDGQKYADLLRIERMKRAALQESEDASRLKIEALQDELQEVQHSERILQQKLIMIQSKYETLGKRHDNLKRQQQELELARESKEALAWLKETTDRLCSPPLGGMGGHMHSRSSHGSAPISIHQHSPSSSSPPYPSSFIDPPLAAQNQLISLIKELATTNSTLRSELNEYRDLLKDSQNEVLTLRSQVEDYEQGQAFENCCGRMDDASDSYLTSQSAWSVMDTSLAGLDAASHIGTLGSIQGSPPPYMTTPSHRRHHHHHHHHRHLASGVRGNVFGELESFYSQTIGNNQLRPPGTKKTKQTSSSSRRRGSLTPSLADTIPADQRHVGTSTSFDGGRSSSNMSYALSPLNPTPATFEHDPSSPASHRISLRMDSGLDTVKSGSELEDDAPPSRRRSGGPLNVLDPTIEYEDMPRFGGVTLAAEMQLAQEEDPSQAALLPPANLKDIEQNDDNSSGDETASITTAEQTAVGILSMDTLPTVNRPSSLKNRTSSISLLSAELQKATRSDSRIDLSNDGQPALKHQEAALRRLEGLPDDDALDKAKGESWSDRKLFQQHEKSFSDQGLSTWRQRRRLSEPLHFIAQQNSMTTKKSRPGSIYSLRRARPHMESPDVLCIHSGHYPSASLGGLPELQRCKSAELVEQIMTERRNRVLEAWRVGVVAAAVTQQQSIHSIVAFGEQRKDSDNISVRSKMSKMSRMSRTSKMSKRRRHGHRRQEHGGRSSGDQDSDTKGLDLAGGVSTAAATIEAHAVSTDLLATTTDIVKEETDEELDQGNGSNTALTIDTAVADSDAQDTQSTPTASRRGPRTPMGKKRQSLLSPKSSRSSLPRSPMARLSMISNRRFPSEASTASEAMSNRRHDQEHTPYQLLHTLSTELLERLARSDTREMNRRLKRTFDIQALSQMSNSVIENVLTDVSNLGERFRWVEAQAMDDVFEGDDGWNKPNKDKRGSDDDLDSGSDSDGSEEADWNFSVEEFFPLANMVQEMLSEVGKLRMTINELQLSYVLKVEQDRIRAEKDFMDAYGSDAEDAMYEGDDDLGPLERVERTPEKSSAQLKNVLGKLERPNILGTASTGVSGFFNKVFGGNNNNNNNNSNNQTRQEEVRSAPESKDKPAMSKSKSGVVAETSHVFAETAWISSPGIIEPKTPKTPVRSATQGTSSTSMSGMLLTGPKLSATTSLAAMATKSPMRSNTVPVPEKLDPANSIATRARAMDISFSPGTSHARSPPASPSAASSVQGQGLFSRSLPKNQFFGAFSAAVSKADTTTTTHQVSSSAISRSSHSSSVVESLEGVHKVPSTPGSGSGVKPPRSIGISTRVSGPALNVVTKQDVFPEQWTTSTSSSLSASLSTVPSTANSDQRVHTKGDGFVPRKPSRAASSSSASVASSSTGAEVSIQQNFKPASKPTLISRTSLTVATPSASTVSSPMSATSWFDSKRNSGFAITEGGASTMTGPEGQDSHASGSTYKSPETLTTTTTTKGKALASFHSAAAAGGSSDSLTRSLGRTSGQSALAFLRREPTSVLGSIFQGQNQSTPALVSSGLHTTLKSNLKGKAVLDGPGDYAKPGLEVLDQEYDDFETHEEGAIEEALSDAAGHQSFSRHGLTTSRSDVTLPAPSTGLSQRASVSSTAVAYVVAVPAHTDEKEQGKKKPVFDRGLIKASQKRILAGVGAHQENKPDGFVPVAGPRRARALSVDSMQSHNEPLKQNEIMDLWRVGAGVSRDIWNGIIKKVDGGRS